jgi:DNA-directed RNA polymerase specialized sigma24 family protein
MASPLRAVHAVEDPFTATHWSVIVAAGRSETEPQRARVALGELCRTYWAPLYSFVRSRGYSVHDAQDLTQSFFAHLIEREIYRKADPRKGRFRTFLLGALKNFLADSYTYAQRIKRGGQQEFVPLNDECAEAAETLFQTQLPAAGSNASDQVFERSWAETLVGASMKRLAAEYEGEGKGALFLQLKVFLTGGEEPPPTYEQLAESLAMPASTLRSYVTRLRARYRELLRAEVRQTVSSDSEVDAELREMFRILLAA